MRRLSTRAAVTASSTRPSASSPPRSGWPASAWRSGWTGRGTRATCFDRARFTGRHKRARLPYRKPGSIDFIPSMNQSGIKAESDGANVLGLQTLGPLLHFELHLLTLGEGTETLRLDRGVMT